MWKALHFKSQAVHTLYPKQLSFQYVTLIITIEMKNIVRSSSFSKLARMYSIRTKTLSNANILFAAHQVHPTKNLQYHCGFAKVPARSAIEQGQDMNTRGNKNIIDCSQLKWSAGRKIRVAWIRWFIIMCRVLLKFHYSMVLCCHSTHILIDPEGGLCAA